MAPASSSENVVHAMVLGLCNRIPTTATPSVDRDAAGLAMAMEAVPFRVGDAMVIAIPVLSMELAC
ncbi:hypothetical protein PRZ48_012099 [Zasmidium cellare]|uniref:Uncharacterized protein n=1 Tax=Zasmidium cellare TaxID=395010 RepID=A0ABR0E4C9_ZASCE|nr:hypothetical protein PRZ48_012099 [Zasmidium cellare]